MLNRLQFKIVLSFDLFSRVKSMNDLHHIALVELWQMAVWLVLVVILVTLGEKEATGNVYLAYTATTSAG